jgi:predicted enzyme related to lactoylglutathione lyase
MSGNIGAIMIFGQDPTGLAKWYEEMVGIGATEAMGDDHRGVMVGDVYLGFEKMNPVPHPGAMELYFTVNDVDEAFATTKARGGQVYAEPRDTSYGGRECGFIDPVGNHVWMFKMKGE